eukprot:scaffold978_cov134-Skeletonema_marinoi.AAC.13
MHYSAKRPVVVIALLLVLTAITVYVSVINRGHLDEEKETSTIMLRLPNAENVHGNGHQHHINHRRRRLNNLLPSDPASVYTKSTNANANTQKSSNGNTDNAAATHASSSYDFAVLIISYHKTGHDLQEDLVKLLIDEFPTPIGPNITAKGVKSLVRRRMHTPVHLCSRLYLQPGTVAVQHAPDLFCNAEKLAKILLEEGGHRKNKDSNNNNVQSSKDLGVKIVHLVRNPFSMAVSNYHYHAKNPIPRPEMWITRQNPCQVTYPNGELFADYVLPSLSKRSYEALNINYDSRLILRSEFEAIANDCESLYQTRKGLETANQFEHLMNLDAPDGLRLATAELTIQGDDNGGDMLRMSNNILKLKQAEKIVQNSWMGGRNKEFQVYTLSLDDFISEPKRSALEFLNFVFDHNEADVSMEQKESAAMKYSQTYLNKKEGSRHITDGKASDKEQLAEYLRHDAVFGPPMKKIEMLVETALAESRNTVML